MYRPFARKVSTSANSAGLLVTPCMTVLVDSPPQVNKTASVFKYTKFSVSFVFLKKLYMMINYYERLEEVFEVNTQLYWYGRPVVHQPLVV